ncbi:hypothetical protein Q428_14225 [Fervidicella metallireducens AeB]|uniref:Probable multidrug resistance protein NorM n=1 Tax=Fervidicella metallireducens AeB TaxID=1403537 RepID=A0A017RTP1_9CLOT|nr:MATE family efflux transporter [Fervidicella metallireducens]EYE87270.1 hypothetical protein Q428_14225 [Fervidicella metallireducens AeB]
MEASQRKELILKGNMYKAIITLAIPIMINSVIQTLYGLINGIWVSKLGKVQFAATSFVWPVNFLFISLGMGISIAGTAILSQLIGANRNKEADKYATQIIAISLVSSIIFTILGILISPAVVYLMGARGDLYNYSVLFLKLTFLEIPFIFAFFNFNSIMNAQGNTKTPTVLSAISVILNAILDPIFIFTFNLGIAGAAIATIICKMLLVVAVIFYAKGPSNVIRPDFKDFKFSKDIIKQILKVAIPSALGSSGSALGFIVLNGFIESYGIDTMAAFATVNRITGLVMQPAMGIGAALTTIIGQNLGAEDIQRAEEGFTKSLKFTIAFSMVGCILMLIWDREIISFFMQSGDEGVITESIVYLKYISISMPLMGIFSVLQGVFQGSGHTKYSMNMEIGRLWFVRLPMILLFKHFTSIGSQGIWFSMSSSNLIICLYGYYIYRQGCWRNKIVKTKEVLV